MPDERLDRRPVHESLTLDATAEQPAAQTAGARVDSGDDPASVLEPQLDVMRDDEASRVDADQPAPEHVVAEQYLALAALEVGEVEILSGELHVARLHRRQCGRAG